MKKILLVAVALLALASRAHAGGWYLMMPLENHPEAPISYWSHIGSFDSAKECEKEQEWRYERSTAPDSKIHRYHDLYAGAECITGDDPRLKERSR
jgi:hypothetical protein